MIKKEKNVNGYKITGTSNGTYTITVERGTHDITLSGVNIQAATDTDKPAFSISSGANVNLTLDGTNALQGATGKAGLEVSTNATLIINGTDDDSLNATGGGGGAGIGGGGGGYVIGGNGRNVTISGGTVKATGGSGNASNGGGAGIGSGGGMERKDGDGGKVEITGGKVEATGTDGGAGIGGGGGGSYGMADGGNGAEVNISGGTVTATGNGGGAGIGGGGGYIGGDGGNVTISGGDVTAAGNGGGAGIGGGGNTGGTGGTGGTGAEVNITGGTVSIGSTKYAIHASTLTLGKGASITSPKGAVKGNITENEIVIDTILDKEDGNPVSNVVIGSSPASPAPDRPEPSYIPDYNDPLLLTTVYNNYMDARATVALTGVGLNSSDLLITESKPEGAVYDELRGVAGRQEVLGTYDISLKSGKKGTGEAMQLSFRLGAVQAGQDFTLVHRKADGTYEYFYDTADAYGDLTFVPLYELSPFLLVKGTLSKAVLPEVPDVTIDQIPKTEDAPQTAALAGVLLIGLLGLGAAIIAKRKRV